MGINFPTSPTLNQKYPQPAVAGVPVYTWDGEKWTTVGGSIAAYAPPADAVPLMNSGAGLIGTSTDYAREDHVHPSDASLMAYSGMQINGGMEVSQENGTTPTTTDTYIVDGVSLYKSAGIGISAAQVTDAPPGYSNSVKLSVTTAKASLAVTDEVDIVLSIEGYRISRLAFGSASAQPITISFWSKIHRTGMYSGVLVSGAFDRTYPFAFTQNVADAWEYKTVTAGGDITGTWSRVNTTGLILSFCVAGGSSVLAAVGVWGSGYKAGATGSTNGVAETSDTFQITGVTVLPGTQAPTAAQSPNIMRPYDQELLTCQRYFEVIGVTSANANVYSNTGWYRVSKRVSPTITVISGAVSGDTYGVIAQSPLDGLRQLSVTGAPADLKLSIDARL